MYASRGEIFVVLYVYEHTFNLQTTNLRDITISNSNTKYRQSLQTITICSAIIYPPFPASFFLKPRRHREDTLRAPESDPICLGWCILGLNETDQQPLKKIAHTQKSFAQQQFLSISGKKKTERNSFVVVREGSTLKHGTQNTQQLQLIMQTISQEFNVKFTKLTNRM